MSSTVVYEIAHYTGKKADFLLKRLQLIAEGGALKVRHADGDEVPCKETDIESVIASKPALRKVSKGQVASITCGEDIVGKLPVLLEPTPDSASLFVNGNYWDAFPTAVSDDRGVGPGYVDGGRPPRRPTDIMLPGYCDYDCTPEMDPCWAEFRCAEGGCEFQDQLVGFSSLGLLVPGIAIECGRTDYGGNGGAAAVSVTPFDDFATTFVDWLLRTPILGGFWQGDRYISSPDVDLFARAAIAPHHQAYWEDDETADERDDSDEYDDEDADDEYSGWDDGGSFASRRLELHLPQELIDEVRAHLSAMNPKYAELLDQYEIAPGQIASPDFDSKPPNAVGFVGEVGQRVRNLCITNVSVCPLSSSTVLVEGRDPSDHLVKWVTRSQIDAATESITFSVATVKAHESSTGTDKTVLTAAKVAAFIVRKI